MDNWIATDAELPFIGDPVSDTIASRSAARRDTKVVYCTTRARTACEGLCRSISSDVATCMRAPGASCAYIEKNGTQDVEICSGFKCDGNCIKLSSCTTLLDDAYNSCRKANINSIRIIAA